MACCRPRVTVSGAFRKDPPGTLVASPPGHISQDIRFPRTRSRSLVDRCHKQRRLPDQRTERENMVRKRLLSRDRRLPSVEATCLPTPWPTLNSWQADQRSVQEIRPLLERTAHHQFRGHIAGAVTCEQRKREKLANISAESLHVVAKCIRPDFSTRRVRLSLKDMTRVQRACHGNVNFRHLILHCDPVFRWKR